MKNKSDGKTTKKTEEFCMALNEKRGYWKLKEEALDRTVWRTRFGESCGHVRQTTE
jgi:hypothetical protein